MSGPYDFETRSWSAALHQLRLRKLLRILAVYDFSSGSYADVGCGDGFATAQIMRVTRARSDALCEVSPARFICWFRCGRSWLQVCRRPATKAVGNALDSQPRQRHHRLALLSA